MKNTSTTITLISLSSGFGNIPNNVIPKHTYDHHPVSSRDNTGYDRNLGAFVLPEGCVAVSDEYETIVLSPDNKICRFVEEDGAVWIEWGGICHHSRILEKAKSDS